MRGSDGNRPDRVPFLDGIRCLAVLSVMAYHSGVAGFRVGGFFGVDIFFVLSGYLITSLLLAESRSSGSIRLGAFWARRARRLLPALALMLVAVELYVTFLAPAGRYPGFRGDVLSVAFYSSNWHFISAASNYFASSGPPSLLTHTWSLAIEEQFYLLWPLVILVVVRATRRRSRLRIRTEHAVLGLSAAGAVASVVWMAVLYGDGANPSRLYYGTDTHAECLLVGAVLAAVLRLSAAGGAALARRAGRVVSGIQLLAAAGMAWMVCTIGGGNGLAYEGGFGAMAVLTAILISTLVVNPGGAGSRLLSLGPAVYVGRISYGMYLWYFPLFEVLTRSTTGLTGFPLFLLRTATDVAVATVSFFALEQPIRRRLSPRRPLRPRSSLRPLGAAAVAAVMVFGLVGFGPATPKAVAVPLPQVPPGPTGRAPMRILVTGDSTAVTLGIAWAQADLMQAYRVVVDDDGQIGCGVAVSAQILEHGVAASPPADCNESTPASRQWPAELRAAVARFHPDVVVIAAGRWEVLSRRTSPNGRWINITDPADAAYVRDQLDVAIAAASSVGARVAVATSPCFSTGEQPDGTSWPEDSAARVTAYNKAVAAAVARHAGSAWVLPLGAAVCPDGSYHQTIGGVTVRAPDGIHYPFFSLRNPQRPDPDTLAQTEAFGRWLAVRLMPQVIAAGESPPAGRT